MVDEEPGVGLAAAIKVVRSELQLAIEQGRSSQLAFTAGPVELEFELAFTTGKGGGVGIQAWVLSADFKGTRSTATTHRVKISLTPVDRDTGKDIHIRELSPE
jgi:hypothetical protein